MDPQAGNMEESAEKVINIVVIKDPSGWNAGSAMDFPAFHIQHKNSGQQSSQFVQGRNVTTHPPLYKSQSFTVGVSPTSLSMPGHPFIDSSPSSNAFASSSNASVPVNQVSLSSFTHGMQEKAFSIGSNFAHSSVNDDIHASLEVSKSFASTPQTHPYPTDHVMRKKLIRHKSVPLSLQANVTYSDRIIPFSIHSNSYQTCSPSMVSPAHLSIKDGYETFNSPVATTPDSGFCTPSLLSAPFKALLSSTPTTSSECPEVYLNGLADCSPVTEDKSFDSLFNNSIEWKEDDSVDSAIEEEGLSPLNSSLRSVNWLKSFSIGESGLNISPPMPCSSQPGQGFSQGQNQQEGTNIQKTTSDNSIMRENTACTLPCKVKVQEKSCKTSSSLFIPSMSAPIPINTVVMPTQIHSQMPGKPFLATPQCIGIAETPGSRSALGELKMNKRGKSTRTKNKGHFFPRPSYSYTDLIKLAIKSSDDGQLTLREIIAWIEDHFPFFKHEAKPNWKNTVTQSLSQHADFIKVDKRPGRKWTLCSTASHQHLKPVSKPPEIPSHVLASLNKSKRNFPQPILPKISAYALVPIQNLALEAVSQSNGISTVQANPNVLPIPQQQQQQMIRILPNPQQQFNSHPDQANLSSHKSALEKAKRRPCQWKEPKLTVPKSKLGNRGKKQSTQPSASPCPALGQNVTPCSKNDEFGLVEKRTNSNQQRSNALHYNKEKAGLQKDTLGLSNLSKQHAFPMDSVVDIHEEEGNHPGEKKIILVLKDNQKCKTMDNNPQQSVTKMSESDVGYKPAFKRKLTKSIADKVSADPKKRMCLTKKSGPVMNLRHILQQDCHEDRVAAETIGQLLLEEDNKVVRGNAEFKQRSGCEKFTQLKSDPRNKRYMPPLQSALESRLNEEIHCPQQRIVDNGDWFDRNYPNTGKVIRHNEKMLPAMSKKSNIFRKVNIIKNKTYTSKLPVLSEKLSSSTNVNSDTSRAFASASQLIFSNPTLGEESDSLSISSSSQHLPELHSTRCVSDSSDLPRPTLYRTKSRRKQVHVPLTNEISPIRSCDKFHDNGRHYLKFQKILSSKEAGSIKSSSSTFMTSDTFSPSPKKSTSDDHNNSNNGSSSSCSDVENPSSLHFFSTFSKTQDISNKENITLSDPSSYFTSPSLHQTRGSHSASKGTGDSKLGPSQFDGRSRMSCTPHSSNLSHTSLIPTDTIPAVMCTPPCGSLLRTHSITTTSASFGNEPLTTSSLSPSLSPGVMQQLNSIFPVTPPSIMTPLSMSTPNRSSSYQTSASRGAGNNSEVSPLPGNAAGILDSSFLDHLETLMADLHPQQSSSGSGALTRNFSHS